MIDILIGLFTENGAVLDIALLLGVGVLLYIGFAGER